MLKVFSSETVTLCDAAFSSRGIIRLSLFPNSIRILSLENSVSYLHSNSVRPEGSRNAAPSEPSNRCNPAFRSSLSVIL